MLYELFIITAVGLYILLAVTRYQYAVTLLAGLLPTYLLRANIFGIPTTFLEISTIVVLCMGLYQPEIRKQWLRTWYKIPVHFKICAAIFLASCTVAAFIDVSWHSLGILKGWVISPLLWGWIVASTPPSLPFVRGGKNSLITSGVVVSIIGLFQIFSFERITSIYDVPNSLALFLVPLIILALRTKGMFNKTAGFIMFVALLGTRSVGGIVALGVVLLFIPSLRSTTPTPAQGGYSPFVRGRKTALLLILLLVFVFFSGRFVYFTSNPLSSSLAVRLQLWQASVELIKQHPLLGIGLGSFEPAYQLVLHQWFSESRPHLLPEFVFRDPHTWILSMWLNVGLLGLLSFIGMHVIALYNGYKSKQKGPFLALCALLIFGLVDTIYWKNDLASLQWMLLISIIIL